MSVIWHPDAKISRSANGGYLGLPENIILKPDLNGRSEETDVAELAEDILHRGQLISGICMKNSDGWPVLIAGHRRLRAIVELNKSVPNPEEKTLFKFNYAQIKTEEEALDLTVAENRNRTSPNALDDCYNIQIYATRYNRSLEDIARKYFPGATTATKLAAAVQWVKDRQKLMELSPEAQEKLRKGEFSTSAAQQLAKLQPVEQNKVLTETAAKGKKLKVQTAKDAVEASKPAKRREISDNSPVKLLNRYKLALELCGALAGEVLAKRFHRHADPEVIKEYCEQILVMAKKLNVPLEASSDRWASENLDIKTVIDNV